MPANQILTHRSGQHFESELVNVIKLHTAYIWHNVGIQTIYTKTGVTEVDILFCFKGIAFLVEAKNVSAIIGEYGGSTWSFIGSKAVGRETKEYSSLNTITQNNIHVRSFKDAFFANFGEWPITVSAIVVPNNCMVSEDISTAIYTVAQLDEFLNEAETWKDYSTIHRRVAGLLAGGNNMITRPDFVVPSQRA